MFETLCTEGLRVTNQPEVLQQIDQLQQQLNEIQNATERQTSEIEERQLAFVTLSKSIEKFQTIIHKYESKLYVTPVINTVDLQILNHELALSKVSCLLFTSFYHLFLIFELELQVKDEFFHRGFVKNNLGSNLQ